MTRSLGCVLHLPMTEGTGSTAEDASRYGNDGTINGDVRWQERGMLFDGSTGYLDCGNDASLQIGKNFTYGMWVHLHEFNRKQRLFTKNGDLNTIRFRADNRFYVALHTAVWGNIGTVISGIHTEPRWYHITVVYGTSAIELYVDGAVVQTHVGVAFGSDVGGLTSTQYIGQAASEPSERANATIDDPFILNHAWDADEVMDYYEATKHRYV